MAVDNIKDFTVQWIVFGLLMFSLITFSIGFIALNNPGALGDTEDKLSTYGDGVQSRLVSLEGDSNILLNISSQNNPEVSDQGSKDSVATAYGFTGSGKGFFEESMDFMGFIFGGVAGQIIISVIGSIVALSGLFFIIKSIRQGG